MNRFGLCLLASLLSCSAALVAGARENIAQTLSQTAQQENQNYKKEYDRIKADFSAVCKAKNFSDYKLSCQEHKLSHVIAFGEFQRNSLESRTNELTQTTHTQKKMLSEKNKQVELLFSEIGTIRKMLHESLTARNNLERAYLDLDQKFQLTQQNYHVQVKQLNDKLIKTDVQRQAHLESESKALQQVALLGQALQDNELFYTKDVNQIFDDMAFQLETTRSQLALATDACSETEHELNMCKQQLEITQRLLDKQGLSPKTEKDLKTLQLAIKKVGKQAIDGSSTYHQQLAQALDHIQKLDRKLDQTQKDLAKNDVVIQGHIASQAKGQQDIKILNSELARLKREYQSNLAQNNLRSARSIKSLTADLTKTKHNFERAKKTLAAKDMAFGTLEKHCQTLQSVIVKEKETQNKLLAQLTTKETELKATQTKMARVEKSEHNLRELTKLAQGQLIKEMATTKELGAKLRSVSKTLADTLMEKNDALASSTQLEHLNTELTAKLRESERQTYMLTNERNNYMFERHKFANAATRLAKERNMFVDRLNTVIQTVSTAQSNAPRGISALHPEGLAIV